MDKTITVDGVEVHNAEAVRKLRDQGYVIEEPKRERTEVRIGQSSLRFKPRHGGWYLVGGGYIEPGSSGHALPRGWRRTLANMADALDECERQDRERR
jgi:hypothetical protein